MLWLRCLNSATWQGPKFDEQGFSAKIGDELLAFKLDRPGLLGGFWVAGNYHRGWVKVALAAGWSPFPCHGSLDRRLHNFSY